MTSVTFPSPHPSSLAVPDEKVEGHPQVGTVATFNKIELFHCMNVVVKRHL